MKARELTPDTRSVSRETRLARFSRCLVIDVGTRTLCRLAYVIQLGSIDAIYTKYNESINQLAYGHVNSIRRSSIVAKSIFVAQTRDRRSPVRQLPRFATRNAILKIPRGWCRRVQSMRAEYYENSDNTHRRTVNKITLIRSRHDAAPLI